MKRVEKYLADFRGIQADVGEAALLEDYWDGLMQQRPDVKTLVSPEVQIPVVFDATGGRRVE